MISTYIIDWNLRFFDLYVCIKYNRKYSTVTAPNVFGEKSKKKKKLKLGKKEKEKEYSVVNISVHCRKVVKKLNDRSSDGKATDITAVSLLEVRVALPTTLIFEDEAVTRKYNLSELAQLPKTRLGEGTP